MRYSGHSDENQTNTEISIKGGVVAVPNLMAWFRNLCNWFVGGVWICLEMQVGEALECC